VRGVITELQINVPARIGLALLVMVMILTSSGCLNRGKIRPQAIGKGAVTIEDLAKDKANYDISYAGSLYRPIAILFDLKGDKKRLMGDIWSRTEADVDLRELLQAVSPNTAPYKIYGSGGTHLYGYLAYTKYTLTMRGPGSGGYSYMAVAKVVDENTLDVNLVRFQKFQRASEDN